MASAITQYRPMYINGVDSTDYLTSRGFNYHQGPEWLWPTGYFFRAKLNFAVDVPTTKREIMTYAAKYERAVKATPWRGLPEICNENGSLCPDGSVLCPAAIRQNSHHGHCKHTCSLVAPIIIHLFDHRRPAARTHTALLTPRTRARAKKTPLRLQLLTSSFITVAADVSTTFFVFIYELLYCSISAHAYRCFRALCLACSCPTQAWSVSCVLDALYDLARDTDELPSSTKGL
jgi:hypothetical protein